MRESKVKIGGSQAFTLPRDVKATIIPAGHTVVLPAGDRVTVMQALGGTATVTTREGEMARLTPEDSVDFGFVRPPQQTRDRQRCGDRRVQHRGSLGSSGDGV